MNNIDTNLVTDLIKEQFPKWAHLEIKPVEQSGDDNRTFHLGEDMSIRLPSAPRYVTQVEKEQTWLPILSKETSFLIPTPVAKGRPSESFPYPWSIYKWIEGETLKTNNVKDRKQLAKDLASFLLELQSVHATKGPKAGEHNFFRGGDLYVYHEETTTTLQENADVFDTALLLEIWTLALASKWEKKGVWLHGDIAPGNILIKDGSLQAIIDFGILGVGDPACDGTIAWTFFDAESRKEFMTTLSWDNETWNRARGWALWKALITFNEKKDSQREAAKEAYWVVMEIAEEYRSGKQ